SVSTAINVDGDNPTPPASPGDRLNVDVAGTTNPFLSSVATPSGLMGVYKFDKRRLVIFQEVETLSPAAADLSAVKTDGQPTATTGRTVNYTFVTTNNGPIGQIDIAVTDTFPAALTNVSCTASFTPGSSGATSSTGDLSQSVELAAGGSVTY